MDLIKYTVWFRRFSLDGAAHRTFEEFRALVARLHGIGEDDFRISYVDHKDNDLLPINNTDNYQVSQLAKGAASEPQILGYFDRKCSELRIFSEDSNSALAATIM